MDTDEQENTDLGEEMYDAATAPEPVETPEAKEERVRDERGRFAAKEESPPVVEEQPVIEAPKEERADHRIPLTELLNEREKRQAEARRAQQLQHELEALRQQMQPPKQIPDQFQDPEAYNQHWEQRIAEQNMSVEQRFRNQEANFSLRLAHMQHGETFEKAYAALLDAAEKGDRAAAQAVANSPDPGATLVNWYRREQTLQQVGPDPEAFVQKKLEEALNDPQFLAKAIEKARATASTQPSQVKLPPSLNKVAGSRADTDSDMSDGAMYRNAIGR